ncbi:MAG: selenocysteine-specific translation elongation factor [Thermodesulfobacteriota bacterium]
MDRYYTIGVAGHVDHGKTSLIRCLTGIDTDRRTDEKLRGISIDAGIAPLDMPDGHRIALVDVPGHTDYLKNTVRGLHAVDSAVLVVAADDGIMPQTVEHLEILRFFKVSKGFVVLSKTDLVDPETREIAMLEIEDAVKGTFLEGCPIVPFSAVQGAGREEVLQQIIQTTDDEKRTVTKDFFRMWIDQVRIRKGFGTVVSGTILSGSLRKDDAVQLLPAGTVVRARTIESHGRSIEQACPGQRVGVNLHKIPATDVVRGMALSQPDAIIPSYLLNADLRLLGNTGKNLKSRQRVKLHIGASVTSAMIVLMDAKELTPGGQCLAQLRLLKPAAARSRDPFVVTPLNRNTVIGGGTVLEPTQEKYRSAKSAGIVPMLSALRSGNLAGYLDLFFGHQQTHAFSARELTEKTGWPLPQLEAEINARVRKGDLIYIKGLGALAKTEFRRLKDEVLFSVERLFQSNAAKKIIHEKEIAHDLSALLEEKLLQGIIEEWCHDEKLTKTGGGFLNPYYNEAPATVLSPQMEQTIRLLLEHARSSGMSPFSADSFWKAHEKKLNKPRVQQAMEYLAERKQLIRLRDNRFLDPESLEIIKERVRSAIQAKGFITLSDSREILGYGRWGGAPVLDHLDKIGFTVRIGDKRLIRQ